MKLLLHELRSIHAALRGHPTEFAKCGALALQRSGHSSPVRADVEHDGQRSDADIEWVTEDMNTLRILDENRVTEDGAEAVAIAYAHGTEGWLVKRRLQRGEHADWLMQNTDRWLALEVSGTTTSESRTRLREKQEQVSRCTLPAERLAVVVGFAEPLIVAGGV